MTAEQLRAFRKVVRTYRDLHKYATGGTAMAWKEARTEFERALGIEHVSTACWLPINHRINSATHRLIGVE